MGTITFHFVGQLEDSMAVVDVQCQIDSDGDCSGLDSVTFKGLDILEVISSNQWEDLEFQASKAYKAEQYEQATIDYDLERSLEAVYGLSKPSFYTR